MVAIVTLVFSLCWLPITFYIISVNLFQTKSPFLYYFKIIGHSFSYLNSAVNPLIYAFLNRSFRNNCGSILSKPTCSLLCRKNYQQQQQQNRDYQPSNSYITKEKDIVIDNSIHLSPHNRLSNDFSDAEYETPDRDSFPQPTINPNEVLLMNTKFTGDRPLTTSL
jgi:hypothetical protein